MGPKDAMNIHNIAQLMKLIMKNKEKYFVLKKMWKPDRCKFDVPEIMQTF